MKAHFETRLRRLRLEILDSELSDGTPSTLLGRLDAALERTPRATAIVYTVVLPAIISLPSWYKQLVEFLGSIGLGMPTDVVINFISENISTDTLIILAALSPGYLLTIPITAFLAKRGVFIGMSPDKICFPGGQGGSGVYYSKEREILAAVEVRVREAPTSLCRPRAKADITRCSKLHRSQQHLKSVSCRCFRAAGQGEAARGSAIGHTTERDLGHGLRS